MNGRLQYAKDLPDGPTVVRAWRANGVGWSTIELYLRWVRRFLDDCARRGIADPRKQLRMDVALRWAEQQARVRDVDPTPTRCSVRSALHAWSWGLAACGREVPSWHLPTKAAQTLTPLLRDFIKHRVDVRGLAQSTVRRDLAIVLEFASFLRRSRRTLTGVRVVDVDHFLENCGRRMALKTLARVADVLRAFFRFLFISGRVRRDLSASVAAPRVRRNDRPARVLSWPDVQRVIRAVDRKARSGLRDHALLLVMAAYGLGSGEARMLTLESIDWRLRQLRVVRPKTGREVLLPLLPDVARVLAAYLRRGRPCHCTTRALFVQMHAPYGPLTASSAVRHVLHKHAKAAGITTDGLGSHVLRHSHACRQIDGGASATVVGEILGHRRPESTSTYIRVALRRLRGMALPVPR